MTRTTNARIAGFTYLLYIAAAFPSMVLFERATNAKGIAAQLAGIAQHASNIRIAVVLTLICCFTALVLAVTLYRVTRDEDRDVAMLAMTCRAGEGVLNAIGTLITVGMLWLGTAAVASGSDVAAVQALGAFILKAGDWNTTISATFFAAGSTLFSYLLLRGRMVPVAMAWLGVVGSGLLVVTLPLQLAGFLTGPLTQFMWLPVALFELTLGPWLLIKGVRE